MTLFRDTTITIILAVAIFFGLRVTIQNYVILEHSMEPNFYEGQRVLVNKIVYRFHDPQRGDVIILKPPPPLQTDGVPFIKRIIGLPGETVEVSQGEVYINSIKLAEHYLKEAPKYTIKRKLGDNEYFLLGDNRNNSNDSHTGWTIPSENIIGKAWLTIWPPDRIGLVNNYLQPAVAAN